ncbi:bifunctional riboflavin biosynthesis protein RIBA 1, chloroplastic-like protein, partial [Tanacetum coccineum]
MHLGWAIRMDALYLALRISATQGLPYNRHTWLVIDNSSARMRHRFDTSVVLLASTNQQGSVTTWLELSTSRTMKLMTNNPAKYSGIKGYGLEVVGRVALLTPITNTARDISRPNGPRKQRWFAMRRVKSLSSLGTEAAYVGLSGVETEGSVGPIIRPTATSYSVVLPSVQRVVDENDERLKGLKKNYGEDVRTQDRGCGYFMWKDDLRLRLSSSLGPSTTPSSYPGPSTRPSYYPEPSGSAPSHGEAECLN